MTGHDKPALFEIKDKSHLETLEAAWNDFNDEVLQGLGDVSTRLVFFAGAIALDRVSRNVVSNAMRSGGDDASDRIRRGMQALQREMSDMMSELVMRSGSKPS